MTSPLQHLADLKPSEILPCLEKAAQCASIDRQVRWGEKVITPIYGRYAKEGAEKFLSTLIYPDSIEERIKFINALQAKQIKELYAPHTDQRKAIRASGAGALLDIPNKRIDQILKKAIVRLNKRNRAAWVMEQKLSTSPDPSKQSGMDGIILKTSLYASPGQQQYGGWGDEKDAVRAFNEGVMYPSRRVIHMAMAFYAHFEHGTNSKSINLMKLILHPSSWLQPVILGAELYRLAFGDMFPSHETSRLSHRRSNFRADMSETILMEPYIKEINSQDDYNKYLAYCEIHSSF